MVARVQRRYKQAEGAAPRSAAHTGADSAWATMWRKVFQAALCWLTLSGIPVSVGKKVTILLKDNESAESGSRLYRNAPFGVYASGAPYAAYSFHLPAFIAAPKPDASRVIPVKEHFAQQSVNGYLRDSYGNKFVDTPHVSTPFKNAFAQQFLQLQELPAHLTQPLVAAPQTKQSTPHYFTGLQYRLPAYQVAQSPTNFGGFSQPFGFAQNFRSIASSQATPAYYQAGPSHGPATPTNAQSAPTHTQAITVQQRPSSNKPAYSNSQSEYYKVPQNEVKFQRLESQPQSHRNRHESHSQETAGESEESHDEKAHYNPSTGKTTLTAVVNGKKTSITLDTKPPVPLLDLSLLEPLTFDNPLVPQIQHYLPKISGATYHKLPNFNVNEQKQHKKEVPTHKSKSSPKKKAKQSPVHSDNNQNPHPVKPTITVKGVPDKTPEFSYEINSPNYKETYKEQSISYNKASEADPVEYNYDEKTESKPISYTYHKTDQKAPVHYNFVHTSSEPVNVKQVNYQGLGQGPKQLIYTFKPNEQKKEHRNVESDHAGSAEDSGSSEESNDATTSPTPAPAPAYPQIYQSNQPHKELRPVFQGFYLRTQVPNMFNFYNQNGGIPQLKSNNIITHRSNGNLQLVPNAEVNYDKVQGSPHSKDSPKAEGPIQHVEAQYHAPQEYEENIRISSSPSPAEDFLKQIESYQPPPLSTLKQYQKFVEEQTKRESSQQQPQSSGEPIVHEKAKRIIIHEESPEEMHSHDEQVKAEEIDQENNNEEEFEKAYKNAAFGFAAFDKQAEDIEDDIYSPNNYGFAPEHAKFDVEKSPFQEYQAEGDSYPKSTRANYKDARDGNKEDYYLEFAINKPESLADRYQNKANYFKLYKSHKPEKYFGIEDKKKKSEKYSVAPSFDFGAAPKKQQQGYFAQYKAEPVQYGFSYDKEAPRDRDSSAHASRPYQRLKSKTNFVEPQFQYGFEPIGLPRLLDSELAAMASNDSPESEKPGTRKKIYHENWYIKKTSTTGGEPS